MTFTAENLGGALLTLLVGLLIVGAVVAMSIASSHRRDRNTLALDVVDRLSLGWVFLCGIGVLLAVFQALTMKTISLDQSVLDRAKASTPDNCDFAGAEGGTELDCYGAVVNPPVGAQSLMLVSGVLLLICSASIAWAIHVAAQRAALGAPFDTTVPRVFVATAIIVMTTAVIGGILRQVGMTVAAQALPQTDDAFIPFELSVPVWPFAVGVGCFALAAIFRHGSRLQGEKEQLEKETEGLV